MDAAASYERASDLSGGLASALFELGDIFSSLISPPDLDKAAAYYRQALDAVDDTSAADAQAALPAALYLARHHKVCVLKIGRD